MRRVVVTGMSAITPVGQCWKDVAARLAAMDTGIVYMPEWEDYDGLLTKLAAPVPEFTLPAHYTRKVLRSMGRTARLAVRASELALEASGLSDDPVLTSGATGVAYGSSSGSPPAIMDFGAMLMNKSTSTLNANTYIKMMSHTSPVNLAVYFGLRGRVHTTSSACTSASQGIGYAYEAIKYGLQTCMVAGGTEELSPTQAAVFDTLYATSTRNDAPDTTPRPFDRHRDGLVIGEGAGTLVLEELTHARARGANIIAELVGYGSNCDGAHVTQPSSETMQQAMQLALNDAGLAPSAICYVSAHGTATDRGDVAESHATAAVFGSNTPLSAMKSFTGHTLGGCGAIEAWAAINMLNDESFHATANLREVDPECAELDYIQGENRNISGEYVMSNNFAFGGINTSLIFRRWP